MLPPALHTFDEQAGGGRSPVVAGLVDAGELDGGEVGDRGV
ncbi:hypothetical protein ABZT34_37270 [Streptomyces sp. NPDC005329]